MRNMDWTAYIPDDYIMSNHLEYQDYSRSHDYFSNRYSYLGHDARETVNGITASMWRCIYCRRLIFAAIQDCPSCGAPRMI